VEPLTRRRIVGASVGAAAAASVLPPMLRQAVANASEKLGSLSQTEHIVVLMQENRSFGHYSGSLPGVRGFGDKDVLTLPDGRVRRGPARRLVHARHPDGG
jgi:phospholipase C